MDTKILEEIGLTKNEIKVYLTLLKLGSTTTGAIIKETSISNSRVYESLRTLIKKGLVNYIIRKEGKYFTAVNPKIILTNLEEKKKKIERLLPELKAIKQISKIKEESAIYEGFKGFKTAFEKIIQECKKNDEVYVLGLSPQLYAPKSLRIFLKNIDLKRYKKGIKLKIILDRKLKDTIGKDREEEPLTAVKYMPESYFSPAGMDIFKDNVMILIWEEKPTVFIIKNSKVADSFKEYFKFLWKLAKK